MLDFGFFVTTPRPTDCPARRSFGEISFPSPERSISAVNRKISDGFSGVSPNVDDNSANMLEP